MAEAEKEKPTQISVESGAKRLCLDMKTKVQIILDKSESPKIGQRQLARKYGCSKSQIQRILSHRAEIIKDWESDCSSTRKRGRSETYGAINSYLWEWYQKCIQSNIHVNGRMLHDEALAYAKLTGVTAFDASRGWLEKWKKRHGVAFSDSNRGRPSIDGKFQNSWAERSSELMSGFQAEDIWNMELTAIYWKALPTTMSSESERGIEQTPNRKLTWAFFFNAAGEKMEPIVIGKNKLPMSFRKLRMPERPFGCRYFSNVKSLIQTSIMKLTLMRLDRRLALERRQILLYLDTAPYHPKTLRDCVQNIHIEFLPKKSPQHTPVLESHLIRSWKIKTRNRFLRYVCSKVGSGLTVEEIAETASLLDTIQWGKLAWDELDAHTVTKCFKKIGLFSDEADELDDLYDGVEFMDLKHLCEKIDSGFDAMQYIEDKVPTCEIPVDASDPKWREMLQQQLIKNIIINQSGEADDNDLGNNHTDDYEFVKDDPMFKSSSEACDSLEQIKLYANNIDDEDLANMLENALDRLRSISINQRKEKMYTSVDHDRTVLNELMMDQHSMEDQDDRSGSMLLLDEDSVNLPETEAVNISDPTNTDLAHDPNNPVHPTAKDDEQDVSDPPHNVLNQQDIRDQTSETRPYISGSSDTVEKPTTSTIEHTVLHQHSNNSSPCAIMNEYSTQSHSVVNTKYFTPPAHTISSAILNKPDNDIRDSLPSNPILPGAPLQIPKPTICDPMHITFKDVKHNDMTRADVSEHAQSAADLCHTDVKDVPMD
ncbi:uncharacterized protein [Antedon mediterranea]|uniref:uncharacterized protein n=1 Tax=Antedon mediterranea TaxID=105859 RepID=UPI003AF54663